MLFDRGTRTRVGVRIGNCSKAVEGDIIFCDERWNLNLERFDRCIQFRKTGDIQELFFDRWSHEGCEPPTKNLEFNNINI